MNWYTIVAFRQLASNAAQSIKKGDRVIAFGRPRVRDWTNADRSGTTMEVEVDSLGHDLLWGRTAYTKTAARRDPEAEPGGAGASPAPSPEVVAEAAAEAGSAGSGDTSLAGAHWPTTSVGGTAPVETREPAAAF